MHTEDSDQLVHPRSEQSLQGTLWVAKDQSRLQADLSLRWARMQLSLNIVFIYISSIIYITSDK